MTMTKEEVYVPGLTDLYGAYITKFDSPLSSYMYSKLNEGVLIAEDEWSDGNGEWAGRFGRRVLREDDRGFVYHHPFSSVEFAKEYMDETRPDDEEDDTMTYESYGIINQGRVVCLNHLPYTTTGFDE